MTKVFIDGSTGTTGLRIHDRLARRSDLELIVLPEARRKELSAREEAIHAADVVFLCLPDDAAVQAVELVSGDTAVIDASTAHRTAPGWEYGFPELALRRERIRASRRVANPGCHASGFIALVEPLVQAGLIGRDEALCCFSLTGYSGGGKKMIDEYRAPNRPAAYGAPRQYALGQNHKHLPEMTAVCGLERPPVFCPIVADFYSGMQVTVPLAAPQLRGSVKDVEELYRAVYAGPVVRYAPCPQGMLPANALSGSDGMVVSVAGNGERVLLIATFDNLGKGASGAAIQNMNILLGLDETCGLELTGEGL